MIIVTTVKYRIHQANRIITFLILAYYEIEELIYKYKSQVNNL